MKSKIFILSILLLSAGFACKQKTAPQAPESPQAETIAPAPDYQKMIIAKAYIKPGKEADFINAAKAIIESSNKEEGCLEYMLYQDPYEKTNFIFVEKYINQAAIDFHFAAPYFSEFGTLIADWTSKPTEIRIIDIASEK
ncbi:MAG: antibiotic biosynthesis monooxygenase [Bacteroidales bacterium]|nr:antibiotic biosynthesis monooxygenase [Bacteroidales bacterium]